GKGDELRAVVRNVLGQSDLEGSAAVGRKPDVDAVDAELARVRAGHVPGDGRRSRENAARVGGRQSKRTGVRVDRHAAILTVGSPAARVVVAYRDAKVQRPRRSGQLFAP